MGKSTKIKTFKTGKNKNGNISWIHKEVFFSKTQECSELQKKQSTNFNAIPKISVTSQHKYNN